MKEERVGIEEKREAKDGEQETRRAEYERDPQEHDENLAHGSARLTLSSL